MTPNVVVDIGNTRIKWGMVAPSGDAISRIVSLPDDESSWQAEIDSWRVTGPLVWVLASVQPARADRLKGWLEGRGDRVVLLSKAEQLPLTVGIPEPDKAGIDRLLDAVAATRRVERGRGAILVDAGSAVTIDWIDEDHIYRGGLIAPGLDLMAKALHSYTALLPTVEITLPIPMFPADRTIPAMQAGIFLSVSGCISQAIGQYAKWARVPPRIFFTGGQAELLIKGMKLSDSAVASTLALSWDWQWWPEQTLLGILYSAETIS